ncbi:hypothetical protein [Pedobacter sp. Leaf176]|uniref:hypothetical protein n=1 Tax=Pedobacter sp. Leaf176 TaxID=1736286 RepID=UPI0006F81EBB|nr:hypothetical protein [Pedobacter sp. Leaf176]KQR69714.1 hypothetical protein ASF92_13455 [Pedobacter sp. Leaf176]
MKKLLFLSAAVACFTFSKVRAQNVNGVRLSDIHVDYVEISPVYDSGDLILKLDYGQKYKRNKDLNVRGDDGKELLFNSYADCLNKLKNYGYELFQTYTYLIDKDNNRPVYILKRK